MADFENVNWKAASEDPDLLYSSYKPANDFYYWYTFGFGCMAFYLLLAVLFCCYQIAYFASSNYSNYIAHQKRREQVDRSESPPSTISKTGNPPKFDWSPSRSPSITTEEEVQRRTFYRRPSSLPEQPESPAGHRTFDKENRVFDTDSILSDKDAKEIWSTFPFHAPTFQLLTSEIL